jgi:hypothetical protein
MAVPVHAQRCPSCRARVREQEVAAAPTIQTGPAAAAAWAKVRKDDAWAEPDDPNGPPRSRFWGDLHDARPVGPGAVAAYLGLRLVQLAGLAVVGIGLARAALALAVDDPAELDDLGWWSALGDVAVVAVLFGAATVGVAAVLLARWATAAGHNLRVLALDPRRWLRSGERVVGRAVLAVGLLLAWWIAPAGPERIDRAVDLGLGVAAAAAVVVLATAVQRLLATVTTTELRQADLLIRIESASALRPRHR